MSEFQGVWYKADKTVTPAEQQAKDAKSEQDDPTVETANKISETITGQELDKAQRKQAGAAVHYAFGTIMGGVYGMAAEIAPAAKTVGGLPFGAALFLGADELALPLLHLTKAPQDYPAAKHANGFASHLVWVWTTDLVRRAVLKIF